MSKKTAIEVFLRVRPATEQEKSRTRLVVSVPSSTEVVVKEAANVVKKFSFNGAFGPSAAQVDVYKAVVQPRIQDILRGYKCTVLAYGQTGSGKTHTIEGELPEPDATMSWEDHESLGLIPRTLSHLFDELNVMKVPYTVKATYLEIYNEDLIDLLSASDDFTKLKLYEDSADKGSVLVSGLQEVTVCSKDQVYDLLKSGSAKRHIASTLMNSRSSRSHTVFSISVHIRRREDEPGTVTSGKINLVDLAGSENVGKSGAVQKQAREAGSINQSLLTLGRVITALTDGSRHIPYRQSKLTRILQQSLGGETKTSIIATVSPSAFNVEESLSTLEYAHRAKDIHNKPEINKSLAKESLHSAGEEIRRLLMDIQAEQTQTGVYLNINDYNELVNKLEKIQREEREALDKVQALIDAREAKKSVYEELQRKAEALDSEIQKVNVEKEASVASLAEVESRREHLETERDVKDVVLATTAQNIAALAKKNLEMLKAARRNCAKVSSQFNQLDVSRASTSDHVNHVKSSGGKIAARIMEAQDFIPHFTRMVGACAFKATSAIVDGKARSSSVMSELRKLVQTISSSWLHKLADLTSKLSESYASESNRTEEVSEAMSMYIQAISECEFKLDEGWFEEKQQEIRSSILQCYAILDQSQLTHACMQTEVDDWATKTTSRLLEIKEQFTNTWDEAQLKKSIYGEMSREFEEFNKEIGSEIATIKASLAKMTMLNNNWESRKMELQQQARTKLLSQLAAIKERNKNLLNDISAVKAEMITFQEKMSSDLSAERNNLLEMLSELPKLPCLHEEVGGSIKQYLQKTENTWKNFLKNLIELFQYDSNNNHDSIGAFVHEFVKEIEGDKVRVKFICDELLVSLKETDTAVKEGLSSLTGCLDSHRRCFDAVSASGSIVMELPCTPSVTPTDEDSHL